MMRASFLKLLLGIACLGGLLATPAHATRPFIFTESAVTLPTGGTKLEVGLNHQAWDRGDRIYALMTEISYSLYANLDLELELPYEVSGGGGAPFSDGLGDVKAKAKVNFVKERAHNPLTISGLMALKFPTGSAVSGTDEVDVQIAGLASKPFGNLMAHANIAYTFVGDDGALDLNDVWGISVGLEAKTVIPNVTGVGEVLWQESPAPGGESRLELMGGALYNITPTLRADAGLQVGLASGSPPNNGAPDYGLTVGLSFLYP